MTDERKINRLGIAYVLTKLPVKDHNCRKMVGDLLGLFVHPPHGSRIGTLVKWWSYVESDAAYNPDAVWQVWKAI
jgi:hypothetical protein